MSDTAAATQAPPETGPSQNGHSKTEFEVFDEHEAPRPFAVRAADGTVTQFNIHPFDDKGLQKWAEIFEANVQTDTAGRVVGRNPTGLQNGLIGLCLRTANGGSVPPDVYGAWGVRARANCYIRCRAICGLDDSADLGKS